MRLVGGHSVKFNCATEESGTLSVLTPGVKVDQSRPGLAICSSLGERRLKYVLSGSHVYSLIVTYSHS